MILEMSSTIIHHTKKGDREKAVAGEHWKAQTRFRLWTQDAKEEWMIDHKENRWGCRWANNGAHFMNLEDSNYKSLCPLFVSGRASRIAWGPPRPPWDPVAPTMAARRGLPPRTSTPG